MWEGADDVRKTGLARRVHFQHLRLKFYPMPVSFPVTPSNPAKGQEPLGLTNLNQITRCAPAGRALHKATSRAVWI